MGQDDIVFEEVRYREPVRMRRPDRDRRWACLAYEVPGPDDLPVFLDRAAADAVERHALRDTGVELGGILLGKECVDDQTGAPFVWVTRSLEAKHYENTQASFTYTHDSWEEITRERDRLHPDLDVVGWYHTHPDFGIFLSSHDLFIQRHFFGQKLQVAYVVDPVRQTRGFFRWRDGQMEQTGGFYLTAPRNERAALARLANDLENTPDTESPAVLGGLSPRLEAELIAMLTRPAPPHHASSAVDRAQSALLFGMTGATLGALGLAAAAWLFALGGSVREQGETLKALRQTVAETSDRQRVALDALIGNTGGTSPDLFLKRYGDAVRKGDAARKRLDDQLAANELLAARVKQLGDEFNRLKEKADRAALYEEKAKEADDLRASVAELKSANELSARKVADLEEQLDTAEGHKASALALRATRAWYLALGGWTVSLFLAVFLAAAYLNRPPAPENPPAPSPPGEPTPHRIT